ncbi:MAG: hypothetical protein ABSD92_13225 [Candidatus Bathyarchaeia archaeon]|jgi:hypothetical protein
MSEQIKNTFLGDLGEQLLIWHLRSKYKINVAIVKGKGIDLLCKDTEGKLFSEKNQNIGISVKTRCRKKEKTSDTIIVEWQSTKNACSQWEAVPYVSYVRVIPESGTITVFLLKLSEAEKWGKRFNVRKAEENNTKLFEMKFEPYDRYTDW